MFYNLIHDLLTLVKEYEENYAQEDQSVALFGQWLQERNHHSEPLPLIQPEWDGKSKGRSADSVINTSLVHLYRYAKLHAKTAIAGAPFATPDEFIYLINLISLGSMTKTALIRHNVHEKSAGMQIINRLIKLGFVEQLPFENDKRNRIISITAAGTQALNQSMDNIRMASLKVTGNLTHLEKLTLVTLLSKLETHHELVSKELL